MRNILVTNYENTGDNVMVFLPDGLSLSPITLGAALLAKGKRFEDIYDVNDGELPFYLYEPLWADEAFCNGACAIASQHPELKTRFIEMTGYVPSANV